MGWIKGSKITQTGFYFKYNDYGFRVNPSERFTPVFIREYDGKLCILNWEINDEDWFWEITEPADSPPGTEKWTAEQMSQRC